jgi:type VI secretion system secreted protein VgrG
MSDTGAAQRKLQLFADFGVDDLQILGLHAEEALSELFTLSVEVLSAESDVDFLPQLGATAAVGVYGLDPGAPLRYFHGELYSAGFVDQDTSGYRYLLTLRPFLHRLGQNRDYRIFQDLTAVDIIKQVFALRGCSNVEYRLTGSFPEREYCVQYRESDLDFIHRLMEQEGIYYFFEHSQDKHTLVLCNARSSHTTAPNYATVPMIDNAGSRVRPEDHIWTWTERVGTTTQGSVSLRDYNYLTPTTDLSTQEVQPTGHKGAATDFMEYPGRYTTTAEGTPYAQVMLESLRAQRQTYRGDCDTRGLCVGNLFTLTGADVDRLNQEYLVLAISFRGEPEQVHSGEAGGGGDHMVLYALPASTPFRAPIRTPRPVARGPESAVVTGQPGDVICTDNYGRVKVLFYWDRWNTDRSKSSCWMRVNDPSAGGDFGHNVLPRVGQEVIVDFMNGDPDRPFVTGRLYNAALMQAWDLPGNKTRSHWRSQTVGQLGQDYSNAEHQPSGAGFNEIYMEDGGGQEMVYVKAQRDMNTVVQRDDQHLVWRNQHLRVGYNRNWEVKNNETSVVEQGDQSHTVASGQRTTTIQKNDTLLVKQGDIRVDAEQGSIVIHAAKQIVLNVGNSTITIDSGGITVAGAATGVLTAPKVGVGGGTEVDVKADQIKLN